MLNHITIMGRLTRDPELRRTDSGKPVANFTAAVDRDYVPQGQERETDFIDCVAWNSTAEFVSKYFTKGSMIVVGGRLQIRGWTDKDGNKRRTAEIVADNVYFGEGKKSQDGSNPGYNQSPYPASTGNPNGYLNQQPQNYGGYQQGYPQQSYQQPQFNQQGFSGYQQNSYTNPQPSPQNFQQIIDPDAKLPWEM